MTEPAERPGPLTIAERVDAVRARIATACHAAGRDPTDVTIVAATKTRSSDEVAAVVASGILDIGENRVQELLEKRAAVVGGGLVEGSGAEGEQRDGPGERVRWHLIGPLQRNKVAKIVRVATLLHAIDDVRIAGVVSARALAVGIRQRVLLEVNASGEGSKHGVAPEDAEIAARAIADLEGLEMAGLMTIGPLGGDPRPAFEQLRELRDRLRQVISTCEALSMGMSEDLEPAIAAGATLIRPGSALFGRRITR